MVIVKTRSFRPWSKAGGRWTHELVGYGLDLFHRRHLRTPTVRELRAGVDGLPSHATIRRLYGNASTMLRAHGYRVRRHGGQPGHPCWAQLRDERGMFLPHDRAQRAAAASRADVARAGSPSSHRSTASAHRRPSLIAHTISD
jgi:hypothetical protein